MRELPRFDEEGAISYDPSRLSLWSLVLSAAGIPHVMSRGDRDWVLKVPEAYQGAAMAEIEAFEEENLAWPPKKEEVPGGRPRNPPTVLIMGALLLFFGVTGPWASKSLWFQLGSVSGRKVLESGELWRLVTALTLHADVNHLAGNVIIGGIIAHFLSRTVGTGMGWFLALFSGAAGNAINVMLRHDSQISVGFSTAVFGMVGVLCGMRLRQGMTVRDFLLPLGAGAGLLAMVGSAGERVDLGSHLWGLVVGIVLGLFYANFPALGKRTEGLSAQFSLFLVSCLLVWGAWWWSGIFSA